MPKIGVYNRVEFRLGTERLVEDSENLTIVAEARNGETIELLQHHRHESPIVERKRRREVETLMGVLKAA